MADSERDLETALAESMRDAGISPYHRGTTAEGLASGAIISALAARGWRLVPSAPNLFTGADAVRALFTDPDTAPGSGDVVLAAAQPYTGPWGVADQHRELAARFWVHYRCGYVGCEIVEQHEHGGGPPMREMTEAERAALAEARDEATYWRRQAIGAESE